MRFGGPIFRKAKGPQEWAQLHRAAGYSAAYCPLGPEAPDEEVAAYAQAAADADLVIAEVGAWCNPLSPDEKTRREALENCAARLALADRIGARCCVNVSGSRGERWAGPDPRNLTDDTFDAIVESVRHIIDAARPTRTFYTLETMPWMYPDSAESYRRLLHAIDRKAFAVHFDPVNLVCSPQRYFSNAALIRDFVEKLGPHIRSCHAKDILLHDKLTTHLDEVRPGRGGLDYATFLREINRLDPDLPVMLEHLPNEEQYRQAAAFVRTAAAQAGAELR